MESVSLRLTLRMLIRMHVICIAVRQASRSSDSKHAWCSVQNTEHAPLARQRSGGEREEHHACEGVAAQYPLSLYSASNFCAMALSMAFTSLMGELSNLASSMGTTRRQAMVVRSMTLYSNAAILPCGHWAQANSTHCLFF